MAVQRYISSSFWSDEWVDSCSIQEKLVYMYLLTNECTNIAGIYKISLKRIKDDTGITREEIKLILEKFANDKKAFYYNEFIIIPKWLKHQKLNEKSGKLILGVRAVLKNLPDDIKNFIAEDGNYEYDVSFLFQNDENIPYPENGIGYAENGIGYAENGIGYAENAEKPDRVCQNDGFSADDSDLDLDHDLNSDLNSNLEDKRKTKNLRAHRKKTKTFSAACAAAHDKSRSVPKKKSQTQELASDQLALFHAAKACFESSEKAKALMYQDSQTAARQMKHLKTLARRCAKIAPGISADFLRAVLEHFKIMCNGKLKGKAVFTPHSLATPWIWEMVIDSLPEPENPEVAELARSLFK